MATLLPVTPLAETAAQMHELWVELKAAGFPESVATEIVIGLACGKR